MKNISKKLKKLLKDKNIVDIVLFGSITKGRSKPNDFDIAVLQKEEDRTIIKIIKKLVPKADVQIILFEHAFSQLFLVLFKEGYSVKNQSFIQENLGLESIKLYKYDLKQLTQSKKVMFERGLKKIEGIKRLSNKVIMSPMKKTKEFEDFLSYWDLDIDTQEYELMPLLRKEEL